MDFKRCLYSGIGLTMFIVYFAALGVFDARNEAEAQHGQSGRYSMVWATHGFDEVSTIGTNTAVIAPGTINTSGLSKTNRVYFSVSGQGIRYTHDGVTTPTTDIGSSLAVGDYFSIVGIDDIQNFMFVNDDDVGTSTCHFHLQYEKEMN